ncbi:MAG: SPOR domain-containing protein, partial [Flavobacteriales bacterium]|nr:SPOR domain-containing protein [Flavobacteriales bacterium]
KLLGLLSYPFWFFFEWLAPLLEAFGLMLFFLLAIVGLVNWSFFFLMIGLVIGFTITFTVLSLLIEEMTYHNYRRKRDILRLLHVGVIEPFVYHPFVVYSAIMGNIDYLLGKSSWGDMTRKGFHKTPTGQAPKIRVVKGVTKNVTPILKQAPATAWIAVAVAFMAFALYVLLDQDKLLLQNEFAFNKTIREWIEPKPQVSKELIKKEKELFARAMRKSLAAGGKSSKSSQKATDENVNTSASKKETPSKTKKSKTDKGRQEALPTSNPATLPMVSTKSQRLGTFYIVAASYSERGNAEKFLRDLKKSGFKNALIAEGDGKYRVAFDDFSSEERAREYMMNIRINVNGDAWLLYKP